MPDAIYILFLFALGSCVGSFLNVVVWRLPQVKYEADDGLVKMFFRSMRALSDPPSHCPKCLKQLKWYDNIPVLGWIKLGGRCRFCKEPFSVRYPIVEAMTGLLFAGYYWAYFVAQMGPCHSQPMVIGDYWWFYGLHMILLSGLLAASLIDAELFNIPLEIPWLIVPIALGVHAWFDQPAGTGSICVTPIPAALAAGGAIGTVISFILHEFGILPTSFADGAPMLEKERDDFEREKAKKKQARQAKEQKQPERSKEQQQAKRSKEKGDRVKIERPADNEEGDAEDAPREWTGGEIRREIGKEMLFLLLPLALAFAGVLLAWKVEPAARWWARAASERWVSALLGSVLGGLTGGFVVWLTRILGSLGFGREAMGLGDVDLMVAVGAVLGAGSAVAAFFLAPFLGILVGLYMWITRRHRELPYGPYLSLAAACVMLFYCPIKEHFGPDLSALGWMLSRMIGAGGA